MSEKIVVAMSGGVDSSVTAAILKNQGYDVIGVTLQLYDHGEAIAKKGACCAGQDIYDARTVADKLGIPHYVLDYEKSFRQSVIESFADSYVQGETPIPCIICNQKIKFQDLLNTARELGASALATGHYVRRMGSELHRATDLTRDQSYFLFSTPLKSLEFLHFPLGEMTKNEVRRLAAEYALPVAKKPDSQDICFVPGGKYQEVVRKYHPDAAVPGEIVHVSGKVLGRHNGILCYTVGQRKGIGIADNSGEPLFVVKLDKATNQVVVGPRSALAKSIVHLRDVNWLGGDGDIRDMEIEVKLRSAQPLTKAFLSMTDSQSALVKLVEPQYAVAPGQACVFYRGSRMLGGGWIAGAE